MSGQVTNAAADTLGGCTLYQEPQVTAHQFATVCFRVLAVLMLLYALLALPLLLKFAPGGAAMKFMPLVTLGVMGLLLFVAAPLLGRVAVIGLPSGERTV
jgi:hypothetical protein